MSLLNLSNEDVSKVQTATSKVLSDAIGQIAAVLVPAIGAALKDATSGMTVTIGPITIEPIKITIGEDHGQSA